MFSAKILSRRDRPCVSRQAAHRLASPSIRGGSLGPLLFLLACFSAPHAAIGQPAEEAAARTLFLETKCQKCHQVSSAGIEMEEGAKLKGPDLAKVSADMGTAPQLTGYLQRTITKGDKKHPFPWRGKDEDLEGLVKWLLAQQADNNDPEGPDR